MCSLEEMKKQEWMKSMDWCNLRDRPAAITVNVASIDDTSYFDSFPDVNIDISKTIMKNATIISESGKILDYKCLFSEPSRPAQSMVSPHPDRSEPASGSSWMFLNYTFKRFEGFTQKGRLKKKFRHSM